MTRRACVIFDFAVLCTCGGGGGSNSKDWSNDPLPQRAIDYCIKLAACTADAAEGTIAQCVDTMADLQAGLLLDAATQSLRVPTRRELSDLVTLRDCYNKARTCEEVRHCAGVPDTGELEPCDLEAAASSCAQEMGTELLKTCLPNPAGEGGVWVKIDCTKYGRICAWDEDNKPRCVGEKCVPGDYDESCDEATGDISTCGVYDPATGQIKGNLINVLACGASDLGCALFPGDPGTPDDDNYGCVANGESCDPNADAPACDGSVLTACFVNPDGTGSTATWDCSTGAIHHNCDAQNLLCAVTSTTCDPAEYPGTCDGTKLTVCLDGELVETDCRLHGLSDCEPNAEGHGRCIEAPNG